jgi:hypothetical protein
MSEAQRAVKEAPVATRTLPIEMQRVLQVLCDTYHTLDLRIETTLGAAEQDFLAALPEIEGYDNELRQLVKMFLLDLRRTVTGTEAQPVLLRLAFENETDLAEQFLAYTEMQGTAQ